MEEKEEEHPQNKKFIKIKRQTEGIELKIKYETSQYKMEKNKTTDLGFDLRSALKETIQINRGQIITIPTGIKLNLPENTFGQIVSRKGLSEKHSIIVFNAPMTINPKEKNEIEVTLINQGINPFQITPGDRIAQIIILESTPTTAIEISEKEEEKTETIKKTGAQETTEKIQKNLRSAKTFRKGKNNSEIIGTIKRGEARSIAEEEFSQFFSSDKILKGISNRALESQTKKIKDIYSLLHREDFIYASLTTIKGNKGALTTGIDKETADAFSIKNVEKIQQAIKNKEYKFKPVRKIMIPKPGKTSLRPLGIPTFEDRIVQDMIRRILQAIYEPIFETSHGNANYGFRPNKSCHQAITKLQAKAQNMEWCIEGDIKGAYDNVNHDILLEILSERIEDRDFINLIKQGLKSGAVHKGTYEHSILGTPQGGIASPILFNIYLSKLDEYINGPITDELNKINTIENRKTKPITSAYKALESEGTSAKGVIKRLLKDDPNPMKLDPARKERYFQQLSRIKISKIKKLKTKYLDKSKAILRSTYVRYADDWVFFTNANKETTLEIKEKIAEFLEEKLKLTLSPEKTQITNVKKDAVKFLGFSLGYFDQYKKIKKIHLKTRRTTGNQLIVGLDAKRIEFKMETKKYAKRNRGIRKPEWSILRDYEIILRYNQIIRGLALYYGKIIRDFSRLNKYIYLLMYSCLHTLANKHDSSIRKIIKKYGFPPKSTQKVNKNNKENTKEMKLLDYLSTRKFIIQKINEQEEEGEIDKDFLSIRINWRTTYKLNRHCVCCGSTKFIQNHHVNHIKKMGPKLTGFQAIMSSLNRKQITVCKKCHLNIHAGRYDGWSLSELYDPDLATL